jgi:hypothetical protein
MLKGWTAFHAAHVRSYIVFADLIGPRRRQARFSLLGSLAEALQLEGDYALFPEKEAIRLAFEHEGDAQAFADALLALRTAREGGWAGQWAFVFDDGMEEKIRAALPPSPRRHSRRTAAA